MGLLLVVLSSNLLLPRQSRGCRQDRPSRLHANQVMWLVEFCAVGENVEKPNKARLRESHRARRWCLTKMALDPVDTSNVCGLSGNNARGPLGTLEKNLTLEIGNLVVSILNDREAYGFFDEVGRREPEPHSPSSRSRTQPSGCIRLDSI
jgi:hypothetical protein